MNEEEIDFGFGQKEPPLIDYVKQILRNYTGGQLLKELTQNADDAGAGTVKFLYDQRQHGTDRLYQGKGIGDLSPFQGPALCAFNDATFRDDDWISIQNLSRSKKRDDPTKVGRFGMGFVSVYHLTDLPSILSGDYLAFMDPSEKLFEYQGKKQRGCRFHRETSVFRNPNFADQFAPYTNLFGDPIPVEDKFKGTIFRFPLRNERSVISDVLTDENDIRTYFNWFVDDAKIVLLFLKNIESITVEAIHDTEISPFSVKLSDETKGDVKKIRKDMVASIKDSKRQHHKQPFSTIFPINIQVEEYDNLQNHTVIEYKWLVSNYMGNLDPESEMFKLATEHDRLPLVGVAMHVSTSHQVQMIEGRTFCFLPLPSEENCSGLPVHVNADFGVSDDRRSIKWPVKDRDDKMSKWNQLLLQILVPKAYVKLILEAIELHKIGQCSVACVYQTWPDMEKVAYPWKELMCPELFKLLLNEKVFFSEVGEGEWISTKTAIFDLLEKVPEETQCLISKLLLKNKTPIVSIKHYPNIIKTVEKYGNRITPQLVRDTLRNVCLSSLTSCEKINLLEYLLDDDDFIDLQGFELLPVADGSFCKFASGDTNVLFFASSDCTMDLVPCLNNRFIKEDLKKSLKKKIVIESEKTSINQVQKLKPKIISVLLKEALPRDWLTQPAVIWCPGKNGHPPLSWLELIWNFIQRNVCNDAECNIQEFEGITLVPTNFSKDGDHIRLVRFQQNSHIVVTSSGKKSSIEDILPQLHLIPVNFDNAEFVTLPPSKWRKYFHYAQPKDILRIYAESKTSETFKEDVDKLSVNNVELLRAFLKDIPNNMTTEEIDIILKLAVFDKATGVLGRTNRFQAAMENGKELRTASKDTLPVDFQTSEDIIDVSGEDSRILASKLSLKQCPREDVLCQMIQCTENKKLTELIIWIMDRWDEVNKTYRSKIIKTIQDKPFIPLQNGNLQKASECFDPSDHLLSKLFRGEEDLFPAAPFDCNYRDILLQLGLKTHKQVKPLEIKICVELLMVHPDEVKAHAVCELLECSHQILDDMNLLTYLENHQWVPVVKIVDQQIYPVEFPWFQSNQTLASPKDVTSVSHAPLVGSTLALVSNEYNQLSKRFKWDLKPPLKSIYTHLQNIVSFLTDQHQTRNTDLIDTIERILPDIYYVMQSNINEFKSFREHEDKLVWTGQSFVAPRQILIKKTRRSLEPYLYTLSPKLNAYTHLFNEFGASTTFDGETEPMLGLLEEIVQFHEKANGNVKEERINDDRDLVIHIIESIINLTQFSDEQLPDEVRDRILLPVATQNSNCLKFATCDDVCFPNEEWSNDDDFEEIKLVHESVPRKIYQRLGVASLAQKFSGAMSLAGFQQAGQKEDLTQRLKNILDSGYIEDSIAKEMIQNADDAGATEVKFMIDMRTNSEFKSKLLDKGMKAWNGPALWVYNDATFSDTDFENITKIGGRTKQDNQVQIGTFGLGFNSVYHITDVPSFLSRGMIGFLDPHTNYLDSQLRDKSNPGIRIDLNRSKATLRRFKDQFQPYKDIFGCDIFQSNKVNFNGTLFRLPLRQRAMGIESQISDKYFDEDDIIQLMKNVNETSEKLLLFTQHVTKVSVYHLGSRQKPTQAVKLFSVEKYPKQYLKKINASLDDQDEENKFDMQNSILREASQYLSQKEYIVDYPSTLTMVSVEHCLTPEGADLFHHITSKDCRDWLVFTAMGQSQALDLFKNLNNTSTSRFKIPCGGVAVPVNNSLKQGEIFCFLPLSIPACGVPCHINGNFVVSTDRRSLWRRVAQYGVDEKSDWNEAIFVDIITRSYVSLLKHEEAQKYFGTAQMYDLWPDESQIPQQSECFPLLKAFYMAIVHGIDGSGDKPCVFSKDDKWLNFDSIVIYKPDVQSTTIIDNVKTVLQKFISHGKYVVDIPDKVVQGLLSAGCGDYLNTITYTEERFFEEIFFPNISEIENDIRSKLTMHVIDSYKRPLYKMLLTTIACIPTGSTNHLKMISNVVHPDGKVAQLFEPEENRFPSQSFQDETRMQIMVELGMIKNNIEFSELLNRAQVIEKSKHNRQHKIMRLQWFMMFLEEKRLKIDQEFKEEISGLRILPVLERPKDFPKEFPWFTEWGNFVCANQQIYPSTHTDSVCFVKPIVDELVFKCCQNAESVRQIFNLAKEMGLSYCHDVTQQLKQLTKIKNEHLVENESNVLRMCTNIYSHLGKLRDCEDTLRKELQNSTVVLCSGRFMKIEKVALKCKREFHPYLYKLPTELRKHELLFKLLGIEDDFCYSTLLDVSYNLKLKYQEEALEGDDLQVAIDMVQSIADCKLHEDVPEDVRSILVPDKHGQLRPVDELSFCLHDTSDDAIEGEILCHDRIPHKLAAYIGIKDIRTSVLSKHGFELKYGTMFGQVQKLTNRIGEILKGYPCDESIFKELLQNSDDAGADEINFIFDERQHSDKNVFCESWKQTLGPALCVFNNKPFTEDDLKGIQELGTGAKSEHPDKTGQYGIGFNSVYHLTDCPSFLSNNDTLCIFDPHCAFIDQATADSPGFQFNISPKVNEVFRGALSCFRLETITNHGCTLFRFPLRTTKMRNYINSLNYQAPMSKEIFDSNKMQQLLKMFESKAFHMLLYLNNLTKITISHIDKYNKMKTDYWVSAELSPKDRKTREEFHNYVKDCAKKSSIKGLVMKEVTYEMRISDIFGEKQVWLINQRIGSTDEIPDLLSSAYENGNLKLLPRGGIAACLSTTCTQRTYCFLPLPIDTNMPVSINGHFSLDSSRRHLSNISQNDKWNEYVKCQVIAQSYSHLLLQLRDRIFELFNESTSIMACSSEEMNKKMAFYWHYFPDLNEVYTGWKQLAAHVFVNFLHNHMSMFPVVRFINEGFFGFSSSFSLTWLPASSGSFGQKAYFYTEDKSEMQILNHTIPILQQIGFKVAIVPDYVYNSLITATSPSETGVRQIYSVEKVSPDSVVDFLKHEFSPGELPCDIANTSINGEKNYFKLLEYIDLYGKLQNGNITLNGMPMLLTQDLQLRRFGTTSKTFLSRRYKLLPKCWNEFIHSRAQCHFSVESLEINRFSINDLVERLNTNSNLQNANHKVIWDPQSDEVPNKTWIKELWDFLKEEFEISDCLSYDNKCTRIRKLMDNWSVLPIQVRIQKPLKVNFLMPFSEADTVLPNNVADGTLRDALTKMELPVLDESTFWTHNVCRSGTLAISDRSTIEFVKRFIATGSTPGRILKSLVRLLEANDRAFDSLTDEDRHNILLFFGRFVGGSQINEQHVCDLKKLPCYLSIHNECITLNNSKKHFVLHSGIPKIEKEKWLSESKAEFINDDRSLKKLHTLVGLAECTESKVYKKFILPQFHKFTDEARIRHMDRIRCILNHDNLERSSMICDMGLKYIPLISHKDQPLKRICDYFDNSDTIFQHMLQPDMFLPYPFYKSNWRELMIDLGLQTKPEEDMILKFAKKIAEMIAVKEHVGLQKSKDLVKYINNSEEWKSDGIFLRKLRDITFLVPRSLDKNLLKLHERFKEGEKVGISYNGALTKTNTHLVWTSASILPDYAVPAKVVIPNPFNRRHGIHTTNFQELNVSEIPSLAIVLQHTKNICTHLKEKYNRSKRTGGEATSSACQQTLHDVLQTIYEYFSKKCRESNPDGILEELKDIPMLLASDDTLLISPKYSVRYMKKSHVLIPYICAIPDAFVPYMDLFSRLGAQDEPSIWQCCELLTMVQDDINENPFVDNPNLKSMIKFVVCKIFENHKEPDWLQDIKTLYLPNRAYQLVDSSTLMYYDKPMFEVRMNVKNDKTILFDFKEFELESAATMYVENMPTEIKPSKFSEQTTETMGFNQSECSYAKEGVCEQLQCIQRQLQSMEFRQGICRILKHEANQKRVELTENVLVNTLLTLSSEHLAIKCISNLETHLEQLGEVIEESNRESECFLERKQPVTIFIRHHDEPGNLLDLQMTLAEVICDLTGVLHFKAVLKMINIDLNKIQKALSLLNIQALDAIKTDRMALPKLGSPVPDDVVDSLDNDPFNEFTVGEYVVYETDEEEFVYAQILQKITCITSGSSLKIMYVINYGKESTVGTLSLYKWLSRKDTYSTDLQPYVAPLHDSEDPTPPVCENLDDAKNKLSDKLEEIWKLEDTERKKAIKRLYLKWHPDKNPGNEDFCTEVFKHLINEIDHLEKGLPRSKVSAERSYYPSDSGKWQHHYRTWNQRARSYRRSYTSTGGFSGGTNYRNFAYTPSPGQANIWQRQSRYDFQAASNDNGSNPSYEWVAYKCMQAAEKSLKAAILSHTGKGFMTHSLNWLRITVEDIPRCPSGLRNYVNELCTYGQDQNAARYPRRYSNEIPHNIYNREDADKCILNAKIIIDMMDKLIDYNRE
ncbi:sacsin-like [Antedon mediterranea]|uniref:sacsin-like n=1 Tax=Antedon mediterranea TaxID=105859 RepID=UPI003AF6A580